MQTFLKPLRIFRRHRLVLALAAKRRVVVIEEFERTFLRKVNGFEALRSLLQLIYPTAASTLLDLIALTMMPFAISTCC
jgi:hypothetical protein